MAGLGDSLNAMEAAFIQAIKTGNLFYVDWHFFRPELTFDWKEYHDLKWKKENCDVVKSCSPVVSIVGHLTSDHEILKLPVVNPIENLPEGFINSLEIKKYLMSPSGELKSMIDEYVVDGKFECDASVVVRTGKYDYNEFLVGLGYEIS